MTNLAAIALIVSGARNWTDRELIYERLDQFEASLGTKRLIIIEGTAKGVDQIASAWAKRAKAFAADGRVDHLPMAADWKFHADGFCPGAHCLTTKDYCMGAGFRRNQTMVDKAIEIAPEQFVLAFKDDFNLARGSGGTEDLVRRAKAAGVQGAIIRHHAA